MGKILVTFQFGEYPSDRDFTLGRDFSTHMITDSRESAGVPIDIPTNSASLLFTTPQITREKILENRKVFADMVADCICDGLTGHDTLDGYMQEVK